MSLARFPDWRPRLHALLEARRALGFSWEDGRDCCLWAADAILAMTGKDVAAELRGYRSRFGATRRLVELGHRSVRSLVAAKFTPIARPRLGDLVLVPGAPLDTLLIAAGRGAAWGQYETGLIREPIPARAEFWAV